MPTRMLGNRINSREHLRLLFLADAVFEDLPGGSRVAARELARGLAQRGHDVTFLVGRQNAAAPADERHEGIRIVRYPGAGQAAEFVRQGRDACARLCTEEPFDLVHTHFAYAGVGPLRAIPAAIPRVRTFHGPWDEEGWMEDSRQAGWVNCLKARVKRRLRYQIESNDLAHCAQALTLSHCFGHLAQQRYKVAAGRMTVIPGGTDTCRFHPATDPQAVRHRLGLPTDRRILLSVRRLAPRMGLDHLIRAMPAIVQRHPDVLLLLGGKGPEQARLAGMIQTLKLEASVRLIGFIPDDHLAAYYQAADLFVLPTLALEGFGLVTTEALACGLPVVGTPVGATPEILGGLDCRLIAAGTAPCFLAAAILAFLDESWAQALTPERLHQYVQAHYTWERHVDAVEAVYWQALVCKV